MNESLLETQISAGAVVADSVQSCPPVLHFGDPEAEYRAAVEAAAIFDLSDRDQLEFTGDDRAKFLHSFCTNEIKALAAGQGCEAYFPDIQARVLGHGHFAIHEDSIVYHGMAGQTDALTEHLTKYIITEDVELTNRSAEWSSLLVSGETASQRLNDVGAEVANLPLNHWMPASIGSHDVFIQRVDMLGAPGFLLTVSADLAPDIWHACTAVGMLTAGSRAFHARRIEATYPLFGIDMTDQFLVPEIGRIDQSISYEKGCYLGQEPIARIDAMGRVSRSLRTIRFENSEPIAVGSDVLHGEKPVGTITSVAEIPDTHTQVALVVLRVVAGKPGTELTVNGQPFVV